MTCLFSTSAKQCCTGQHITFKIILKMKLQLTTACDSASRKAKYTLLSWSKTLDIVLSVDCCPGVIICLQTISKTGLLSRLMSKRSTSLFWNITRMLSSIVSCPIWFCDSLLCSSECYTLNACPHRPIPYLVALSALCGQSVLYLAAYPSCYGMFILICLWHCVIHVLC